MSALTADRHPVIGRRRIFAGTRSSQADGLILRVLWILRTSPHAPNRNHRSRAGRAFCADGQGLASSTGAGRDRCPGSSDLIRGGSPYCYEGRSGHNGAFFRSHCCTFGRVSSRPRGWAHDEPCRPTQTGGVRQDSYGAICPARSVESDRRGSGAWQRSGYPNSLAQQNAVGDAAAAARVT